MNLNIKMAFYISIVYVVILVGAFVFKGYLYAPSVPTVSSVGQQLRGQSQEMWTGILIIVELAAIVIVFSLERKYRIFKRLWNWISPFYNKYKNLFLAFVMGGGIALVLSFFFLLFFRGAYLELAAILILCIAGGGIVYRYGSKSIYPFLTAFVITYPLLLLLGLTNYNFISFILATIAEVVITLVLIHRPTKNVMNILTVAMAFTFSIFFGFLLSPVISLVVLVAVAVYDYIAVFKTQHMQKLAGTMVGKFPIAFIVGDESYITERLKAIREGKAAATSSKQRRATLLGNGDVMIPMAVAASFVFGGFGKLAVAITIGSMVGLYLNMWLLSTKRYPTLPAIPLIAAGIGICLSIAWFL